MRAGVCAERQKMGCVSSAVASDDAQVPAASNDGNIYGWTGENFIMSLDAGNVHGKDGSKDLRNVKLTFSGGLPECVRKALDYGTCEGSRTNLVVVHEMYSGMCKCTGVDQQHVYCKMLTSPECEWRLERPLYTKGGMPENNPCIVPFSMGDHGTKVQCESCVWILPPLRVHSKMNIYSVDSVDTVNQTFKANIFCELRLRGVCNVSTRCPHVDMSFHECVL